MQFNKPIRGFTPAAPLKDIVVPNDALTYSPIRGFTPAAPLKDLKKNGGREPGTTYPRVHTRGPIEGTMYRNGVGWDGLAAIRGFTPAAPLKANRDARYTSGRADYPRVHTRGPIEGFHRQRGHDRQSLLSAGSHPRPH